MDGGAPLRRNTAMDIFARYWAKSRRMGRIVAYGNRMALAASVANRAGVNASGKSDR